MLDNENDDRVYVVVEAHEVMVLRILLRQAVPMLKRPDDYSKDRRRMLADTIWLALAGMDAANAEETED